MKYDFITVGAGIAGLQLSALLAHDGYRVLVCEKSNHIGGRAFILERDGFIIDNGVHLIRFGPKSATARVFRHINKPLNFVDLGTSYFVDEDGTLKVFPTSPAGFLKTKILSGGEKLKALSLLFKLRRLKPEKWLNVSVKDWMDEMNIKGGVRKYLYLVSASMLVCPFIERASAGELIRNVAKVLRAGKSVMYPREGWKYILNTLKNEIERNGEISTGNKVEEIVIENGKVRGVKTSLGFFESNNVICAIHPNYFLDGVIDRKKLPQDFIERCRRTRPTAGVSIDYCLKEKISTSSGLWYLWKPTAFGIFTSNLCPEVAPPGKSLLTFFYPTELDDMEDPQKAKERERELDEAVRKLFPEITKSLEWKRASHLKMVDGAEVNVEQYAELRPGYKVDGIEGLYFVGDYTCAVGAGGDIGHESVLECYEEITGRRV